MRYKGVIYDLDGTLVDSVGDIAASVNAAMAARGLRTLPVSMIESFVGTGARNLCRRSLDEAGQAHDERYVDAFLGDFLEAYRKAPVANSRLYPGVAECLGRLEGMGVAQGVCTNKLTELSLLVLDELGVGDHFAAVVGRDEVEHCKPDGRHLSETAARLGLEVGEIAYLGDRMVDVDTAKDAGADVFVVSWGSPDALEDGYGRKLGSYDELIGMLG